MASAKEKIINATFDCIAEKGSASVSLRDISKKAQVSLSQIHYYFSGREGLLGEAAAEFAKLEIASLKMYLEDTRDPLSRIDRTIDYVWKQHENKLPFFKVYFDLLSMSIWNPVMAEQTKGLQEQILEIIMDKEMSLGVTNPAVARFILAFTDGMGLHLLQGATQEELRETFFMFKEIIRGLIQTPENK